MWNSRVLLVNLVSVMLFVPTLVQAQLTGFCCDPDCQGGGCDVGYQSGPTCSAEISANGYISDMLVCDPDCNSSETADSGCTTIPLDGGLSLLALAGGGLATAAMRRRREEEEAAQKAA
jgi:hypothetical protein